MELLWNFCMQIFEIFVSSFGPLGSVERMSTGRVRAIFALGMFLLSGPFYYVIFTAWLPSVSDRMRSSIDYGDPPPPNKKKLTWHPTPPIPPPAPTPVRPPVERVYIMSERHTSSNFLEMMFNQSLSNYGYWCKGSSVWNGGQAGICFTAPDEDMFKHLFVWPSSETLEKYKNDWTTLWVALVRNPCDWLVAMYQYPHHRCSPDLSKKCETASDEDRKTANLRAFLMSKWRESKTPVVYNSIFDLRATKLQCFLDSRSIDKMTLAQ